MHSVTTRPVSDQTVRHRSVHVAIGCDVVSSRNVVSCELRSGPPTSPPNKLSTRKRPGWRSANRMILLWLSAICLTLHVLLVLSGRSAVRGAHSRCEERIILRVVGIRGAWVDQGSPKVAQGLKERRARPLSFHSIFVLLVPPYPIKINGSHRGNNPGHFKFSLGLISLRDEYDCWVGRDTEITKSSIIIIFSNCCPFSKNTSQLTSTM